MTSTPGKPAIEPHTKPPCETSSTAAPTLSDRDNQPFRALSRIANPPPGWDRYDTAASLQDRVAIERQWKDNWHSDEAQRLYLRAMARRATGNQAENRTADRSRPQPVLGEFTRKLSFDEQTALHAVDPAKYRRYLDWLFALNAPTTRRWGLREFLHRRDLDREREIACRDDYEVTPEQFGWRSR